MASEINWANGLQDDALEKIRCGGNAESMFSPLWGWQKSCTSTQFLIHSKILNVRSNGAMLAMSSQAGKWFCRLPATKESESLKESMETSAQAWPLITCNMDVAFCHPLSHLKRRAIKADPGHLRTDNTCRVEIRRKFPPWNGRRGTLKTLGRGLKEKEKGQIKWRRWLRGWQFWASNNWEGNWLPFKTATLERVREKGHTKLVAINKFYL